MKLIAINIGGQPPVAKFVPSSDNPLGHEDLVFREWWNRDVIFRASAAAAGTPPGMVPLDPNKQVPYEKRKKLVRREFVELMRNKLGAHLDEEIPELLDALQRSESFGIDLEWKVPGGVVSIGEGTLPVVVGPAAAMMRKISQELIDAYADQTN